MNDNKKPTLRFAPSPTGFVHIGTARTALFNFLLAKKEQGKLLMRIEDTDTERSKDEFEDDIFESMEWLGLDFDEVIKQSERTELYKEKIEKLLKEGKAYISKEEKGDRDSVIRFRNPGGEISFTDKLRGEIKFDVAELGDFVIAKSKDEPLYHLAVVVDDQETEVDYIIRGEDHISNTPRQILLQKALDAKEPKYLHLPLILAPDKSKMSKRHGPVSIREYREKGYLQDALINHLALLGWNPGTDNEIFTKEELIESFDTTKIQKGGAIFNIEKLNWFNKEHIKKMNFDELKEMTLKFIPENFKEKIKEDVLEKALKEIFDSSRINNLSEITEMINQGEFDMYIKTPDYKPEELIWKLKEEDDKTKRLNETNDILTKLNNILSNIDKEKIDSKEAREAIWPYAEEVGRGDVLWPLRYSLSGQKKSPDPFILIEILGLKEAKKRIQLAIEKTKN